MDSLPGNSEIPKRLDKLKTKRFPIVKKRTSFGTLRKPLLTTNPLTSYQYR